MDLLILVSVTVLVIVSATVSAVSDRYKYWWVSGLDRIWKNGIGIGSDPKKVDRTISTVKFNFRNILSPK